jgi:type IV pilus assembly protein PilA
MFLKDGKGFTLIELLIVIAIISILAGIILVAVNPAQQYGKTNDSERKSEISSILSAIYQYQTSPTARGALPQCLTGAVPALADIPACDGAGVGTFDGALELGTPGSASTFDCSTTLIPSYLREMPVDPTSTYSAAHTGYYVCKQTVGAIERVYVIAAGTEVFKADGGCQIPGTITATMCVSG